MQITCWKSATSDWSFAIELWLVEADQLNPESGAKAVCIFLFTAEEGAASPESFCKLNIVGLRYFRIRVRSIVSRPTWHPIIDPITRKQHSQWQIKNFLAQFKLTLNLHEEPL